MPSSTVLITGALGQVGTRCVDILLRRGRTVVAMDLKNTKTNTRAAELAGLSRPGRLIAEYADLLDADAVGRVVRAHQPAAIVHLAAIYSPSSYRDPRMARDVNVTGTRNLVDAAKTLAAPPLLLLASSAAVYGSQNPFSHPGPISPSTPVSPIDQYGQDKLLAEAVIGESGLPNAVLRLAGVMSPDGITKMAPDYLLLMRATPSDNRMHTLDARDAGLAFANAVDLRDRINGMTLLIGGNDSHLHLYRDLEGDVMEALGLGRLGPSAGLPGDPGDERGWSFTGWFDTTESQAILGYQLHDWPQTVGWMVHEQGRRRTLLRFLGPLLRPTMRVALSLQRRRERRGPYADPWTLIADKYGPNVLATACVKSVAKNQD